MKLSVEDVRYISKLAKLSFTQEEEQKLLENFEDILSHFDSIDSIDLSDVDAESNAEKAEQVLRKDEVVAFADRDKLIRSLSSLREGFIQVPRIIE